eukprot:gene13461-biopygen5029
MAKEVGWTGTSKLGQRLTLLHRRGARSGSPWIWRPCPTYFIVVPEFTCQGIPIRAPTVDEWPGGTPDLPTLLGLEERHVRRGPGEFGPPNAACPRFGGGLHLTGCKVGVRLVLCGTVDVVAPLPAAVPRRCRCPLPLTGACGAAPT